MKHLMLCAGGKVHHSKITAGDLLDFRNKQKIKVAGILVEGVLQPAEIKEILVNGDQLYKKFKDLPINRIELEQNIGAARTMWIKKFIAKTALHGKFTERSEWAAFFKKGIYKLTAAEEQQVGDEKESEVAESPIQSIVEWRDATSLSGGTGNWTRYEEDAERDILAVFGNDRDLKTERPSGQVCNLEIRGFKFKVVRRNGSQFKQISLTDGDAYLYERDVQIRPEETPSQTSELNLLDRLMMGNGN